MSVHINPSILKQILTFAGFRCFLFFLHDLCCLFPAIYIYNIRHYTKNSGTTLQSSLRLASHSLIQCRILSLLTHLLMRISKTCKGVANVLYVARNTLTQVESNSPLTVTKLSTSFSRVPALTTLIFWVSHIKCPLDWSN